MIGINRRDATSSQRGFALLVVLWSVVFLAFLMTQILANSRTAIGLAGNLRAGAQARAVDDGAINETIFHVMAIGNAHWPADSSPRMLTVGGVGVVVRIENLAGRVNPNLASGALLAGLLHAVGEPGSVSAALAGNILDWRSPPRSRQAAAALLDTYRAAGKQYAPPGTQFTDLDQLADVIGFTPDLLAKLDPHMSLYQPGDPDPAAADATVKQAITYASATGAAGNGYEGAPTVRITACATGAAPVCRNATVSLHSVTAAIPYEIEQLAGGQ